MKKIILPVITLLLIAGGGSALMARGMWGGGPGYGMGYGAGPGHHGMMSDRLDLTDAQEQKIHRINKDYADKFFNARKDRDAFEKVRENHRKDVEKVLTKEQLEKLNDFRGPRNDRDWKKEPRRGRDWDKRPEKGRMMKDFLELTKVQEEKIHKINMEFHDKMFKSRDNKSEVRKLREEHREKIEKVLSKEQLEKLRDNRRGRKGFKHGYGFGPEF